MSRRVAAGLPSRMAHNRSSLLVAVAAALVAAALPGCGSDGASDQLAEQQKQIEELERRVGDEQKPGTSTAPAPSTSESPGSSPPAAPAASGSRCTADMLRVAFAGSQGAAGTQFAQLRFELRGPAQCTLRGYPGVALLNGARRLDVDVGRSAVGGQPRTVRVAARHPAYFDFSYRTDAIAQRPCGRRVTGLGIIPPDERQTLAVRLPKPPRLCLDSVRVGVVRATSALNPDSASPEPGGASSAPVTACGAAGSVFQGQVRIANVTARNVPCQTAREFAAGFETTSGAETDFRCSEDASCIWRGWTCRNDGRQARSIEHRCEKGDRVVRWQARST